MQSCIMRLLCMSGRLTQHSDAECTQCTRCIQCSTTAAAPTAPQDRMPVPDPADAEGDGDMLSEQQAALAAQQEALLLALERAQAELEAATRKQEQ